MIEQEPNIAGMTYELYASMIEPIKYYLGYRPRDRKLAQAESSIRNRMGVDKARRLGEFKHLSSNVKFRKDVMVRIKKIGVRTYEIPEGMYDDPDDYVKEVRIEVAKALDCHYLQTCYVHDAELEAEVIKLVGGGRNRRGKVMPTLGVHHVTGIAHLPEFHLRGLLPMEATTVEVNQTISGEFNEVGKHWLAVPVELQTVDKQPAIIYFICEYDYDFRKA